MNLCHVEHCDRPRHPGWVVCRPCAGGLEEALAEVPALQTELDLQTARLASRDHGPVAGAAERPLPFDPRASESTWVLRNTLVGWIRDLDADPAHHPRDTLAAMARWLLGRLGDLVVHPAGEEAVAEIRVAVAQAWRVVDNRPERIYFGTCPECGLGDVYAAADATSATCRECLARLDLQTLREALSARVDGHLVTVQEFSGYAVRYLGVPARQQDRLEARVRQWASRGHVAAAGHVPRQDGPPQPTYRFGDLASRLAE